MKFNEYRKVETKAVLINTKMSKHHISDEPGRLEAVGARTPGRGEHGRRCRRNGRFIAGILSVLFLCFAVSGPVLAVEASDLDEVSRVEAESDDAGSGKEKASSDHIFRWAVKTNLFYDVAAWTLNLGGEVSVAPDWTVDLSFNYNGWTVRHRKWKHWLIQPEARWWFGGPKTASGRAFGGHFLPVHIMGGQFNFGNLKNNVRFLGTDWSRLTNERFQGWFFGFGLGYGYSFLLSKHWSIEAEIGIGYSYTRYDAYPCADCGKKSEENAVHHYIGPTKLAVNLIYAF